MYGKHFSLMYQGSMVGAGSHVFAVWGYCIANADEKEHTVLLNPALLSAIIGESQERIQAAIDYLCAPDEHSKCTDEGGRRLVHRGGHLYFMVTHEAYRSIRNNEERRDYMRKYMQNRRGNGKKVNKSLQELQKVDSASVSESVSESALSGKEVQFEAIWKRYPDKKGKARARKSFMKALEDGVTCEAISSGLDRYLAYVKAQRANGFPTLQYQNGSTWFNKGWEDEYEIQDNNQQQTSYPNARR